MIVLPVCLLALAAQAQAQAQAPTRAVLALCYLRCERAFLEARRSGACQGERLVRANRDFDRATLAFFGGRLEAARGELDALSASLAPQAQTGAAWSAACASQWRLELPRAMLEPGSEHALQLVWHAPQAWPGALAAWPPPGSAQVAELLWRDAQGQLVASMPLEALAAGASRALSFSTNEPFALGNQQLCLRWRTGKQPEPELELARFERLSIDLNAKRSELEGWLAQASASSQMPQALALFSARLELLRDPPDPQRSAQFLLDREFLARLLEVEALSLVSGQDPYLNLWGDHWWSLELQGEQVPLRLYSPKLVESEPPPPLLVALHGAGGDENMFFEAYGAGLLLEEARARGWVVVTPRTESLLGAPRRFEALLDELGRYVRYDPQRIWLLGHSLGAVAAAGLAESCAARIDALVLIAGSGPQRAGTGPRTLAYFGALDPIAGDGRQLQLDAEHKRVLEGFGHTLLVGEVLPAALDFLAAGD